MSGKRNRNRYSRKQDRTGSAFPEQKKISKAQITEDLLAACDGYSNAAAFIGKIPRSCLPGPLSGPG